jgi:hypothetical protein
VPRVVRVGGIEQYGRATPPLAVATARSTQPTARSLSPERRPTARAASDVTPFTRRLPRSNNTGQYGPRTSARGSRMEWLQRRRLRGRAVAPLGLRVGSGRDRRGLLCRRRCANHTSSRPAVGIAETSAAGPASGWESHAQRARDQGRGRTTNAAALLPASRHVPAPAPVAVSCGALRAPCARTR